MKPPFSNMAQKFLYISLDLCEFFQILESGDSFLKKNDILKTKSKKNLNKLGVYFSTGTFL